MQHMIKKIIPQRETEELDSITCDLCGKVAKHGYWGSSCWDVNEVEVEVTVRQKDGQSFPEGGSGTCFEVDLCPQCFKEKLVPWLISQGCPDKTDEWYW